MKFSVCTDALFPGIATHDAVRKVKEAGGEAIEFWGWEQKDLPRLRQALEESGVALAAMCTKFTSLVDESQHSTYLKGLEESIEQALFLGCSRLITQVGNDTGEPRDQQHNALVRGLQKCVPLLEQSGITLLVEPLNTKIDHKGYYLSSSEEGFEVIRQTASPRIKLLYDIYHQQIMEGDILRTVTAHLDLIGHLHAAGHPGRHELSAGELNYPYLWAQLDQAGYTGFCGLEYMPLQDPVQGIRKVIGGEKNDSIYRK